MNELIEEAARLSVRAKRIVVLTGAGVSRESGIPTFREAQSGLWANYDPERLATPQGFLADPPLVWTWYDARRKQLNEVEPNPGHYAIAALEKLAERVVVITQNVDGLHARAGSTDIVELHGNITSFYCFDNHHPGDDVPYGLPQPPTCACGSMLRPAVVWFGEALPPAAMERAADECRRADVAFVVGTSGLVQPAASLPFLASQSGARVIEVNPEATPISEIANIFLEGPAGEIFPKIVAAINAIGT